MIKYKTATKIKPSHTEVIIARLLSENGIFFDQEVMFDGCINPSTNCQLRYDFYLPHINTLIEYDGIKSHQAEDVRYRDYLKASLPKIMASVS